MEAKAVSMLPSTSPRPGIGRVFVPAADALGGCLCWYLNFTVIQCYLTTHRYRDWALSVHSDRIFSLQVRLTLIC